MEKKIDDGMDPAGDYRAPSKICGVYLGLPDLWCDWGISDHALLEECVREEWDQEGPAVSHALSKLPPSLVLRTPPEERWHAAMGAASQFRAEDIENWCVLGIRGTLMTAVDRNRWIEIGLRLPFGYTQWVPAPSTIDMIERCLAERRAFA